MFTNFLYGEPGSKCSGRVKNEREGKDGGPHLPKEKSEMMVPRSKERVRSEARRGLRQRSKVHFSSSLGRIRGSFRVLTYHMRHYTEAKHFMHPGPARTPPPCHHLSSLWRQFLLVLPSSGS